MPACLIDTFCLIDTVCLINSVCLSVNHIVSNVVFFSQCTQHILQTFYFFLFFFENLLIKFKKFTVESDERKKERKKGNYKKLFNFFFVTPWFLVYLPQTQNVYPLNLIQFMEWTMSKIPSEYFFFFAYSIGYYFLVGICYDDGHYIRKYPCDIWEVPFLCKNRRKSVSNISQETNIIFCWSNYTFVYVI